MNKYIKDVNYKINQSDLLGIFEKMQQMTAEHIIFFKYTCSTH